MLRMSLLKTQEVLSDYIEHKKDTDNFKKYLEDKNGKQDKRDSKKSLVEK